MSTMWKKIISIVDCKASFFFLKVAGDFSAKSTRISVVILLTPPSIPGVLKMADNRVTSSLKDFLKNLGSTSIISERASRPSSSLSF